LAEATRESGFFKAVFDLLKANKPTGYTILNRFPEAKPDSYPYMIAGDIRTNDDKITMGDDDPAFEADARQLIEFYCAIADSNDNSKNRNDDAKSYTRNVLKTNTSSLHTAGLGLAQNGAFADIPTDTIIINGVKVRYCGFEVNYKVD